MHDVTIYGYLICAHLHQIKSHKKKNLSISLSLSLPPYLLSLTTYTSLPLCRRNIAPRLCQLWLHGHGTSRSRGNRSSIDRRLDYDVEKLRANFYILGFLIIKIKSENHIQEYTQSRAVQSDGFYPEIGSDYHETSPVFSSE